MVKLYGASQFGTQATMRPMLASRLAIRRPRTLSLVSCYALPASKLDGHDSRL